MKTLIGEHQRRRQRYCRDARHPHTSKIAKLRKYESRQVFMLASNAMPRAAVTINR